MNSVLTRIEDGVGRLTLNRPDALHALNTDMCQAMIDALLAWRTREDVLSVVIDHQPGTRGFCAGGDIRVIAESGRGDGAEARRFFLTEYRLNHLLFTYPKPVTAIMDGVTMGGGVGISMPASTRVATEKTLWAMPETGIGLFPDVGGGWHLPRLKDQIGVWLALTGARLKAGDCLAAGIATSFRADEPPPHPALSPEGERDAFPSPILLTPEHRALIAQHFRFDTVELIFESLEADGSDWAKAQLETLWTKSPQTLKVALRQLRAGARMQSFADVMTMEYRLACRVIGLNDFQEGVRAVVIDKDNAPRWKPETLEGVTDEMLDALFAPLPAHDEWTPL